MGDEKSHPVRIPGYNGYLKIPTPTGQVHVVSEQEQRFASTCKGLVESAKVIQQVFPRAYKSDFQLIVRNLASAVDGASAMGGKNVWGHRRTSYELIAAHLQISLGTLRLVTEQVFWRHEEARYTDEYLADMRQLYGRINEALDAAVKYQQVAA